MPYCPRCGVEVDPSVASCPLCATPIPDLGLGPGEPAWPSPYPDDPTKTFLTSKQRKFRAILATTGVFAVAALAVTVTDVTTTGALTWSRYPLASLGTSLVLLVSLLLWHRRPWSWATLWFLALSSYLAALDLGIDGKPHWFLPLGLPLVSATFGLIVAGVVLVRRNRHQGYNVFSQVFALVAAELLAIDGLVTGWLSGHWGWGWSQVAALVLVPLSLLFAVLHFALRRPPDLRRTFHF